MKYRVEIRRHDNDEVVQVLNYSTQRYAEAADMAVQRKLNHEEFYTDLVEVEDDEA